MNRRIIITGILVIILIVISFFIITQKQKNLPAKSSSKDITLYFSTQDAMYLEGESHTIKGSKQEIYLKTIEGLIKGPDSTNLSATIPEGVKVLSINVEDGIARVNFNKALVENHWGGSTGERLTVYSIVNTLTQFPEIEKVRILIAGEEVESLVGHMDLTQPLPPDKEIIKP